MSDISRQNRIDHYRRSTDVYRRPAEHTKAGPYASQSRGNSEEYRQTSLSRLSSVSRKRTDHNHVQRSQREEPSGSRHIHSSRTPTPLPAREPMSSPNQDKEVTSTPKYRRPALERLTLSITNEDPLQKRGHSGDSGRLQDVAIQYLEEDFPIQNLNNTLLVGDNTLVQGSSSHEISPTPAAECRVHTSLRLGPPPSETREGTVTVNMAPGRRAPKPRAAKQPTNHKKSSKATTSRRGAGSPITGANSRKRNITKAHATAKKKLCVDQMQPNTDVPQSEVSLNAAINNVTPAMMLIPATCKGRVDFRTPPNPLP